MSAEPWSLDSRAKEIEREAKEIRRKLDLLLDAARIAIPVVVRAGAAGNVQCREASRQVLAILKQL